MVNVTGLQKRHHPYNIPHLVEKIKGSPLKTKSLRNTETLGSGFINPPSLYQVIEPFSNIATTTTIKNEKSKDYCKADLKQRVLFFIPIFRLAIPAFFFSVSVSPCLPECYNKAK